MKKFVMSVFFILLGLAVLAQSTPPSGYSLAVQGGPIDRTLHFKPGKRLKLKTTDGDIIYTWRYSINDDHVLTEKNQLIYYHDIVRIKGRVMDNRDRVVPGFILFAAGAALVFPLGFYGAWTSVGLMFLFASPAIGMALGGMKLMGHRTFRTNKGWEIQTYLIGE